MIKTIFYLQCSSKIYFPQFPLDNRWEVIPSILVIFCWFNTEKTIERAELRTVTGMIIAVVVSGSEKDYPERGERENE